MTKREARLVFYDVTNYYFETDSIEKLQHKAKYDELSQEKLEKTEKIAFEVKGHNAAYWQILKFESEPTIITEFERICRIDDNVIRYMVVKDEIKRVNKVKENKKAKKETKNVDTQEESKKEEN